MDKLQRLRLFVDVAETGSFSRAAERLNLPRATATVGVQSLERQLGVRLFQRTTRQVVLTAEGEQYLERARRLLEDADDLDGLFADGGAGPSGTVRIDMPERLANHTLIPMLAEFCAAYPGIHLRLGTAGRLVDLVGEGVDCAIRVGPLADSSLIARPLGSMAQVNCAAPAYLARYGMPQTPGDLARGHCAVGYFSPRLGHDLDWEWEEDGQAHSLRLPVRVSVNSSESYLRCGLAGLGLIQVPRLGARPFLASGELVEVLPGQRPGPLPVAIIYPRNRHLPPRVRVLVDWVMATLRPLVADR